MGFVIHWHESAMDLHVFPILIPTPTSLSTQSLWVFPAHQAQALVSCIQPGLVICFTLDNIHVLMLFSRNIPPSPSPTESKILFCTSVSRQRAFTEGLSGGRPLTFQLSPRLSIGTAFLVLGNLYTFFLDSLWFYFIFCHKWMYILGPVWNFFPPPNLLDHSKPPVSDSW